MFIFDAHLDLAMNAMDHNRDLRCELEEVREREKNRQPDSSSGIPTVSFPAMRRGGVGLCVATQIARYVRRDNPLPGWFSPEQAFAHTQAQLAWYRAMEQDGQLRQIVDREGLHQQLRIWQESDSPDATKPIGYILSLEGADSIVHLNWLEKAWDYGLRALGPAHYGPGTYSAGTDAEGGLTGRGRDLLKEMDRLGLILDTTHLTDQAFKESLDLFQGPIWASHCNCRALVPNQRQASDEQIRLLVEREAVIGVVFDAWMMIPDWEKGVSTPQTTGLRLSRILDHIDHICQLAGNARHVGIGSDLDGGFGAEQCPADLDDIEKLPRLASLLTGKGYTQEETEGILANNWIRFLDRTWS